MNLKQIIEVMNIYFSGEKSNVQKLKQDEFKSFQALLYKFKDFQGLGYLFPYSR